jgi:catechol 2,3-dioxygenase-like lactoylglutathione lyase family enzyme
MEQVTGIGGVFLKARDPARLAAWYRKHLGFPGRDENADFLWRDKEHPEETRHTTWCIFPEDTDYFGPAASSFMINHRVSNLDAMLQQLKRAGVTVHKTEDHDYGRFAWVTDPEGNRLEFWEPKSE